MNDKLINSISRYLIVLSFFPYSDSKFAKRNKNNSRNDKSINYNLKECEARARNRDSNNRTCNVLQATMVPFKMR